MAKQPAVVIIARHGARLDAADKSWHLSSPTPYDPLSPTAAGTNPVLSALNDQVEPPPVEGSAINSRDFAALDSTVEPTADAKQRQSPARGKKRKHKIVIHSSPFQRCTQTSIAISAGIAQYQGSLSSNKKTGEPRPSKTANQMHSASPRLHAVDKQFSPRLEPISEPMPNNSIDALRESLNESRNPVKATLRIDAFLGEWLSPEYFEMITPPPNSTMMVAGAKADLLRRGERIEAFTPTGRNAQGNLWASSGPHASSSGTDGLSNMKSLSHTLPRRDRSNSLGIGPSNSGRSSPFRPSLGSISDASVSSVDTSSGYTAPTPAYAVSPADPIPQGYVAHARDACVDIDYQWDSVREPQLWGDGGEFGEEWSHMHKRFRKGLNKMINWYTEHSTNHGDDHEAVPEAPHDGSDAEEDADTDVVAVLVTHGAGCNALIGALTNQPVLIDVGYAAMTMAVRKDTSPLSTPAPPPPHPHPLTSPPGHR
ncbi:hypothetical protein H2203_007959 [Taxawa tesnikishii (nom. ined.)]|nr:hypothetical protein H2203_007959 [Dothideales sp. JES 119]